MKPTEEQIRIGMSAGRKALDNYSSFDSSMVPDDALETFVTEVLTAVLASAPDPTPNDSD